ncbi:MAG: amidase, partial [Alphaproteobacteria bacterium]|nr:amidase [Alphaproteobacteria bacterium]
AAVLSDRPDLRLDAELPKPRIALYRAPEWPQAEPATLALLEGTAERLRRADIDVTERTAAAEHEELGEAQKLIMDYETARCLAHERLTRWKDLSAGVRQRIESGLATSGKAYDEAWRVVRRARQALPALFGEADALLVPSAPGEAPKGLARTGDPVFNRAWTMLHVPCATIPGGRGPNGLPIGLQLVGRAGEDARLLRTAAYLERALTGGTKSARS